MIHIQTWLWFQTVKLSDQVSSILEKSVASRLLTVFRFVLRTSYKANIQTEPTKFFLIQTFLQSFMKIGAKVWFLDC